MQFLFGRLFAEDGLEEGVGGGRSLMRGQAGTEPGEDAQPAEIRLLELIAELGVKSWKHVERQIEFRAPTRHRASEVSRCDAGDDHGMVVDQDLLIAHIPATEVVLPERIAQNDHGTLARLAFIGSVQEPASGGLQPERVKEVATDEFGLNALGLLAGRESGRETGTRDNAVERGCPRPEVPEHGIREAGLVVIAPRAAGVRAVGMKDDQGFRISDGQRAEQHLIEKREDGCGCAYAQREGKDGHRDEVGRLSK
jgi:hypothetical protein